MKLSVITARNDRVAQQKFDQLGLDSIIREKPGVVSMKPTYSPIKGLRVYIVQDMKTENFGTWVSGETAAKWRASTMMQLRKFLTKYPETFTTSSTNTGSPEFVITHSNSIVYAAATSSNVYRE